MLLIGGGVTWYLIDSANQATEDARRAQAEAAQRAQAEASQRAQAESAQRAQAEAAQRNADAAEQRRLESERVAAEERRRLNEEMARRDRVVAEPAGCEWDPGWDDGFIKASCSVYNPANRTRNATIKYSFSSGKGRNLDKEQVVALTPGERKTVSVKIYEANEGDVPGSSCTCSIGDDFN